MNSVKMFLICAFAIFQIIVVRKIINQFESSMFSLIVRILWSILNFLSVDLFLCNSIAIYQMKTNSILKRHFQDPKLFSKISNHVTVKYLVTTFKSNPNSTMLIIIRFMSRFGKINGEAIQIMSYIVLRHKTIIFFVLIKDPFYDALFADWYIQNIVPIQ